MRQEIGITQVPPISRDEHVAVGGSAPGADREIDVWDRDVSKRRADRVVRPGEDPSDVVDREADPTFTKPIEFPAVRSELEAWRSAKIEAGRAFPVVLASPDAEVVEQLELLGYADE